MGMPQKKPTAETRATLRRYALLVRLLQASKSYGLSVAWVSPFKMCKIRYACCIGVALTHWVTTLKKSLLCVLRMNKPSGLPSFKKPPVVEVVIGLQFTHPIPIQTLQVADVWAAFGKDEYVEYSELKPLDPILPPNMLRFEISDAPDFPRYLFKNATGTSLIQFQRDRLVYNWSKCENEPPESYPRFGAVLGEFLKAYESLAKAIGNLKLSMPNPGILELAYVNLIDAPADMSEISEIFSDIEWKKDSRFLTAPNKVNLTYDFPIEELKANLSVNILSVQLVKDGRNMLKYELSVKGPISVHHEEAMVAWYEVARGWIVKSFKDMTTDKMHKFWEIEP